MRFIIIYGKVSLKGNIMKKTILITGGAGFIGSHLCEYFLKNDHKVVCLDNMITGNVKNINKLKKYENFVFIKHDIVKGLGKKIESELKNLIYIYDLACPASPVDFSKLPMEILDVCSKGTQNLLELAKKYNVPFLQTSTSEVYGDPKEHPQKESYWGYTNCYGPRSCYDEGKRYAEALIYNYRKKYRLKTQIVRIFNTYGPQMRADDGRVVSTFIVQALHNKPITVFGDGKQTRSFCYIDDMVGGILKMSYSDEEGPINIGNPGEFTINELAEKVIKLTDTKSKIIYKPLPKDDPRKRRPDITLAKKKLDWQPKISLDEGLKKTIEHFRKVNI